LAIVLAAAVFVSSAVRCRCNLSSLIIRQRKRTSCVREDFNA
jgi:hypothetical protein